MAKLPRVLQRVFGSGAGTDQIAQFGSLAASGSPGTFTTDPAVAQSLSNWLTGWFGAVIGGNAPAIEDMNAAMFVMTYQLAYIFQAGIPEWDTSTVYYIGSLVNDGAGGIFISLSDNNTGNPVTDVSNWRRSDGSVRVASKTANYTLIANDGLITANAAGGGFTLSLPLNSTLQGKVFYFKKVDGSSNVVTISAAGSDSIDGASTLTLTVPFESVALISDGAGLWSIF